MFFSQEDYELEVSLGRESLEGDGAFTIVLYRIDRIMTIADEYGESRKGEVVYKIPIELNVMPILDESENMTFNATAGTLRDEQDGNIMFVVYQAHLTELDVEITYGDYVGYMVDETSMRFYSVTNPNYKNYDNPHTIMGYKAAYRVIKCAPVDENEFTSE